MTIEIFCNICGAKMSLRSKNNNDYRIEYYAYCDECDTLLEQNLVTIQRLHDKIAALDNRNCDLEAKISNLEGGLNG